MVEMFEELKRCLKEALPEDCELMEEMNFFFFGDCYLDFVFFLTYFVCFS